MPEVSEQQHDALRQQIHDSLQKAGAQKEKLKRSQSRYSITGIVLGALATFTAGQAAILGGTLMGGWRITCAVASGLALGATVVATVQRQTANPELLAEVNECVGKLRALKVDIINPAYNLEEARRKYQQIVTEFTGVEI